MVMPSHVHTPRFVRNERDVDDSQVGQVQKRFAFKMSKYTFVAK